MPSPLVSNTPRSSKLESGVDAAGLAWSLGFIGYKADAATSKALSASLKASAADLTPAHAIDAAWGLGVIGAADKDTVSALFAVASSAIQAAPDSVNPFQVRAGLAFWAGGMHGSAWLPCLFLCHVTK